MRQTVKTSGIDGLALTKLDILDGFEEIKVCTAYKLDGEVIETLPAGQAAQARVEPIYETIEGWSDSSAGARSWSQLPAQAIKYVRRIEELVGAPVSVLSTSPNATIRSSCATRSRVDGATGAIHSRPWRISTRFCRAPSPR